VIPKAKPGGIRQGMPAKGLSIIKNEGKDFRAQLQREAFPGTPGCEGNGKWHPAMKLDLPENRMEMPEF